MGSIYGFHLRASGVMIQVEDGSGDGTAAARAALAQLQEENRELAQDDAEMEQEIAALERKVSRDPHG